MVPMQFSFIYKHQLHWNVTGFLKQLGNKELKLYWTFCWHSTDKVIVPALDVIVRTYIGLKNTPELYFEDAVVDPCNIDELHDWISGGTDWASWKFVWYVVVWRTEES